MKKPPLYAPGTLRFTRARAARWLSALVLAAAAGSPAWASDAKASKFYEDALVRYDKRDLPGAIIQLKNALQADKNMLPAHLLMGKALFANGDPNGAEVAFSEALRLGVNRAEVVVALARCVIQQGQPQQVLDQQRFAIGGLPPGTQAQLLLVKAIAAADTGDARAALKAIEDARALEPMSPESWTAEVPIRIRARQYPEALAAARKALSIDGKSAEALYQLGSVQHVQGDKAAALASYAQALGADADHLEARVARAGLLLDLDRMAELGKELAELKKRAPNEPRAAYVRAQHAERTGDANGAKSALARVTELIDPVPLEYIRYRSQLLLLNGMAHYGLGQREKAKPYLEAFNRAQPGSPVAKLLAQIHIGEKSLDRAVDVLETYVRNQPNDPQALALLASVHLSQGRHTRATSMMQDALRRGDSPEFHSMLGLSLMRSGQVSGAVEQLETAYRKDPRQTQAASALVMLYLRNQQAPKALTLAQALVKQDPKNAGFANLLGYARSQANDQAGARQAYEQALKLDPDFNAARLNLIRLEIAGKAYDQAAARLAEFLKADERNVEALFEMAVIADRRRQPAEAERWLLKAMDHSGPREWRAGLALVDLHMRQGRNEAAVEVAKAMNAKAPDELPLMIALARAQLATNDAAAAKAVLNNATRLANFEAVPQVEIAGLQIIAKNLPGAAYSLEKALSDKPDYLPALSMMAEVEARQGEYAKADVRIKQIIQKYPQKAIGYSIQGAAAVQRGQIGPAIDAYRKAHQVEPSTDTLLRLFQTLQAPDFKAALQLAESWLKARPTDRAVRVALAQAHVRSGNFSAARAAYEELVRTAPNDANSLNDLANVLHRLNDPTALKVAEQALAVSPGNPAIVDTVGWLAFQSGAVEKALQHLRDARLRDPSNPVIRYHLAAVLAKSGRRNEAREELEVALRGQPGFDGVTEAKALLLTLK